MLIKDAPDTGFADFQNDALLGRAERADRAAQHEEAAHEQRNWVRLSYDCNNRCTFCLDSEAHNGTMRSTMDIKVQIVEGRKRGAERLILSGGEPTMHPNFLDFVRLGKRAGYPKVQTVTNGRMFRYPAFLEQARRNGLDEITFSLHGHTAKLHDALVGTPGAFDEETEGLKAALASGAFIVNIDIVINKQNVRHLADMLETFVGWGVREFDLLHIIPFGNAWTDARDHLFYDLEGNLEHLQRALAFSERPGLHIWLNRFPPPYAEGYERLIQDPYKLNDEVRGRREEYDRYLAFGQKLHCREPERCRRCYLEGLCDGLDAAIAARQADEVDVIRYAGEIPRAGRLPAARVARLVGADLDEARRLAAAAAPPELELELYDYAGIERELGDGGALFGKRLIRCFTARPDDIARLAALGGGFEIAALLTKATAPAIRAALAARRAEDAGAARIAVVQPNYDRVTDALANDVDLAAFFADCPEGVAAVNVPRCLAGRAPRPAPRVLDLEMLGPDARIEVPRYTRRFVADGYYTKALRCGGCAENARCAGVHVNWARAHSYAPLSPIPG